MPSKIAAVGYHISISRHRARYIPLAVATSSSRGFPKSKHVSQADIIVCHHQCLGAKECMYHNGVMYETYFGQVVGIGSTPHPLKHQ